MAYIVLVEDPLKPIDSARKERVSAGISIRGWLHTTFGELYEFPVPTICLLNGQAVLRKEWGRPIKEGDVVVFVPVVDGIYSIIAALVVVLIAVTVVVALNTPKPVVPGEAPASDPVFSVKGQQNSIRLGEPIEVCYGRNRIYPSLAARPYYEYNDNDQFQYSLLCVGQGFFDIDEIRINDTPIASYQEATYEVYDPGEPVTLFPTSVVSSLEAGGQTLFAPNEAEYVAPGWVGPFVANPANTEATSLSIDLVFPRGLYYLDTNGNMQTQTASVEWQIQLIDNAGAPLGAWTTVGSFDPNITGITTTPIRRTFSVGGLTPGRYQSRLRRTNNRLIHIRAGNEVQWDDMRAFLNTPQNFGNVTLIAIRIRATSNLNNQSNLQFNCIATRMLAKYESGGMSVTLYPTRSIVWALVDAFRATYGGRITEEKFFDWDTLLELDDLYVARGDYFDWVFRDPITVWEAAKTIARVGRAVPLLVGSLITMKRDGPQDIPVAMFTPDNIIGGSFEWQVKLWDLDEHDSIRVEYTDPDTGYKQEQVVATLPGGTIDNPEDITFAGIQSRAQAYREGLYMRAVNLLIRENITVRTGMEGYIPSYGDLVAIRHDVPRWGSSGYIVHAELLESGGSQYQLWLSEPVSFDESVDYEMLFRGRKGEVIGPLLVSETADPKQVIVDIAGEDDIDWLLGGETEPMLYLFGAEGQITKYARISRIEPEGGEAIRLTCVNDAPRIHSFDTLEVPALNVDPYAPVVPDLPIVQNLHLTLLDSSLRTVLVSWSAAKGALYYIVQLSNDGDNWSPFIRVERTSITHQLPSLPAEIWARVAGVNVGQGPWAETTGTFSALLGLELLRPWYITWEVGWSPVLLSNLNRYEVKVYDNTASTPVLKRTATTTGVTYDYSYTDAVADGNVVRDMLVSVNPIFAGVPSPTPSELELHNDIPPAVTDLASTILDESGAVQYRLSWTLPTDPDLIRIKVWLSTVDGFDPDVVVPIVDHTGGTPGPGDLYVNTLVIIELESDGTHPPYYWRVAVFDLWGNELETNLSAQQTIPAYS